MKRLIFYITLLIFSSCSDSDSNKDKEVETSMINSEQIKSDRIKKEKALLENSIDKNFSNSLTKDKFIISIKGTNILEGTMTFRILNSKGKELLNEEYPSIYLIGYGLTPNSTKEQQRNYIKKRVAEFFKNENFTIPAISKNETFDEDYSEKSTWEDIKSKPSTVGFYYSIGEEEGCRIAFSTKTNKVVKYFCCC